MPARHPVTLLSDFGLQDPYVGIMKGAIATTDPHVPIHDLTHQLPAQNVAAGRFALASAAPYFPEATVHVAVVDPGVGSQRRGIAVAFEGGFAVGPDNGLLGGLLALYPPQAAVTLTEPAYWRTRSPSATFHGRDIFAPVGAHLARGTPLAELGERLAPDALVQLPLAEQQATATGIAGCIQYVDAFGNLITNVAGQAVRDRHWWARAAGCDIPSARTYSDRAAGELLALEGSHGWVELAVNGGSAQSQLQLEWGSPIELVWHPA
ncbi:MAG: hypothetical protein BRC58_00365 [Cyanobacteria bacterium QS_8_64_29]|nr:MAG: hypothetical protein BRC58_00365 [Cyanobacteria bacterium QS_8_64_29]